MNKRQFISELAARLSWLSPEEKHKILQYYDEIITDRIEDGVPEAEAVAAVGSVDDIVENIRRDMPFTAPAKVYPQPQKQSGSTAIVWIILAVVTSPIWLSLLFATIVVVWALVITLFALIFAFGAACLSCLGAGVFMSVTGSPAAGLCIAGAGLICGAITLFLIFPIWYAARGLVKFVGFLFREIKALFARKRGMAQ